MMFGMGGLELLLFLAIALLSLFWLWMLIDAVMNEPTPQSRLIWAAIIFITWAPGALVYNLARYGPRKRTEADSRA